jgi:hypothetical protein
MGYFGEIVAGVVAEVASPHSLSAWVVPAHLFRHHNLAFEILERARQGADMPSAAFGRTGDDCLAFIRNDEGEVTHALVCEAKCYSRHDPEVIEQAHAKASSPERVPTSVLQVVDVLRDSSEPDDVAWVGALQRLYLKPSKEYKRMDMITYVCGQRARDSHGYLACDAPHRSYTARRELEAIDIHLRRIWALVKEVYGVGEE